MFSGPCAGVLWQGPGVNILNSGKEGKKRPHVPQDEKQKTRQHAKKKTKKGKEEIVSSLDTCPLRVHHIASIEE